MFDRHDDDIDDDDFYMVLPSNASPNTHPDNNAANFTVSWETPIILDPNVKWKVALTELSYIYHPHTISSNLSIYYEKFDEESENFTRTVKLKKNGQSFYFEPDIIYSDNKKWPLTLNMHGWKVAITSYNLMDVYCEN